MENMENLDDVKDYLKKGVSWKNAGFFFPFHTPKKTAHVSFGKPMKLLGKPNIFGNQSVEVKILFQVVANGGS